MSKPEIFFPKLVRYGQDFRYKSLLDSNNVQYGKVII